MSMCSSKEKVPINTLLDTDSRHSLVLESALPITPKSDTGDIILRGGVGMCVLLTPVLKFWLGSNLVEGDVCMGVCPVLLVEEVSNPG